MTRPSKKSLLYSILPLTTIFLTFLYIIGDKYADQPHLQSTSNRSLSEQQQQCGNSLDVCSKDNDCCYDLICDKSLASLNFRCRRSKYESDTSKQIIQNHVYRKEPKVVLQRSAPSNNRKEASQQQPKQQGQTEKSTPKQEGKLRLERNSDTNCLSWREECSYQSHCCENLTCATNPVTRNAMCSYVTDYEESRKTQMNQKENKKSIKNSTTKPEQVITKEDLKPIDAAAAVIEAAQQQRPQQQPKLKNGELSTKTHLQNDEKELYGDLHKQYQMYLKSKHDEHDEENKRVEKNVEADSLPRISISSSSSTVIEPKLVLMQELSPSVVPSNTIPQKSVPVITESSTSKHAYNVFSEQRDRGQNLYHAFLDNRQGTLLQQSKPQIDSVFRASNKATTTITTFNNNDSPLQVEDVKQEKLTKEISTVSSAVSPPVLERKDSINLYHNFISSKTTTTDNNDLSTSSSAVTPLVLEREDSNNLYHNFITSKTTRTTDNNDLTPQYSTTASSTNLLVDNNSSSERKDEKRNINYS